MAITFQIRRDTAATWTSVNPVLALGEPALETDSSKTKYGDGITTWTSLPYSISLDSTKAAKGANSDITSLTGLTTPLSLTQGGTGGSSAATARTNLGLGTLATQSGTFSGTSSGTNTGDQTRASLGAAASGVNNDITSFTGVTTPLSLTQGGTGSGTATAATAQWNVFTSTLKGLAPLSGGGTANFLRADGTWAAPSSGAGTVTSASVTSANGFAGTVATPTTTPAITISTTITGLLKGNGTALSAATAATDYVAPSAYASANGHTMSTARLLGRTTAATGAAEEISVAGGLTLTGGILTAPSSISGNAGTATTLATGRTLAVTGDLTWTSPSFNGSANVTAAGTLATVNANIGAFGSAIAVPVITVNAKGLVTAVTTAALGTAAAANTGTSGATVPLLNGANTWSGAQRLIPVTNYTSTTGSQQLSVGESSGNSGYEMRVGYASYQGVLDALSGGTGTFLNLNPSGGQVKVGGALSVAGAFALPVMSMVPVTDYTTLTGVKQLTINEATNNAAYGLRIGFVNAGSFQGVIDAAASGGGVLNLNPSGGTVLFGGAATSKSPTAGIGYSTGAGGAVTQATSKATGVTLNTVSGAITLNAAALASATAVSFTLTDSAIAPTDLIILSIKSGATAGAYHAGVDAVGAGTATISLRNLSAGSLSEAVVLNFAVIKAVAA
jgi:hypothetical protein